MHIVVPIPLLSINLKTFLLLSPDYYTIIILLAKAYRLQWYFDFLLPHRRNHQGRRQSAGNYSKINYCFNYGSYLAVIIMFSIDWTSKNASTHARSTHGFNFPPSYAPNLISFPYHPPPPSLSTLAGLTLIINARTVGHSFVSGMPGVEH